MRPARPFALAVGPLTAVSVGAALLMGATPPPGHPVHPPVHHAEAHHVYRHYVHHPVRHQVHHPVRVAYHPPIRHVVHRAWLPPPPPWPRPADTARRVLEAGLHPGHMEGMALHIHQHLDVFYSGRHVVVPAGIGLGPGFYSEVHTHTTSGTIHVESPVIHDFTLGQFFAEWGVPLKGARVYDDGRFIGNPHDLILRDQQEIAVVYGHPPRTIPKVYPGYKL